MKVLANDGISASGAQKLEDNGFEVIQKKVAQDELIDYINKEKIDVILVRSATKIRKDIIDACQDLKMIGRGGVGLDNIDVEYAESKGTKVFNTPAASSESVAELVFAHLLGGVRHLNNANRDMPLEGDAKFKELKKSYKGIELKGKTLGIIGLGRIGKEVAKRAYGLGMNVIAAGREERKEELSLEFSDGQSISFAVEVGSKENLLKNADFITLHMPAQENYVIDEKELNAMKENAALINTARGGLVNEKALVKSLNDGHLSFAALDVFENEPNPEIKLLMNPKLSLSPHIGGATLEAQDRIGIELADHIIDNLVAR